MDTLILIILGLLLIYKLYHAITRKSSDNKILKKKGNFIVSDDVESLLIN